VFLTPVSDTFLEDARENFGEKPHLTEGLLIRWSAVRIRPGEPVSGSYPSKNAPQSLRDAAGAHRYE
jgi:hypothetical protein